MTYSSWSNHSHSISLDHVNRTMEQHYQPAIYNTLLPDIFTKQPQKEPPMTTLDKVRKERQEALERLEIEGAYADYDALNLDQRADGVVYVLDVTKADKEHTYALLKAGGLWWATGGRGINGASTEDLVAWLIGMKVPADALMRFQVAL